MKIIKLTFILSILLFNYSYAQEGWFEQTFDTTLGFNSVCFVNENIGWIAGVNNNNNSVIYKTTNGGSDWQEQLDDTVANHLYSINFFNANIGCAVGENGTILMTSNGREIWQDKSIDTSNTSFDWYESVQFVTESIGYIAGSWKVIKTTDGGETWETKLDSVPSYEGALTFINSNIGWVLGYYLIYKTTNGGQDWITLQAFTGSYPRSIFFINDSIGWFCEGETALGGGYIRKSTNGGGDWFVQLADGGLDIPSFYFVDENFGWAIRNDYFARMIYHTSNGGDSWEIQPTSQDSLLSWRNGTLYSIYFTDTNIGWAVGNAGTILKTTNSGVSFVEGNEIKEIATDYHLSNNYPNPFNPSTKIKYSVPQSSQVQNKVFDMLGNEIETLISEEKQAGTYEITWYVESLPSGIYFYRLQAGSFVETKKMVLMK